MIISLKDQPWEPRLDNGYPNVIYDPENADGQGVWRCWYGDCISGCSSQVRFLTHPLSPSIGFNDLASKSATLLRI